MFVSLAFIFAIARDNIFSEIIIARLPTGNEVTMISDSSRLSKLEAALDTFANAEAKDMLIGSGLGTGYVRSWFPVGTKPFYSKDFSSYGIRNHLFYLGAPHNSYMVLLNELGLIGTGLLLVLLAVLVKRTVIGLQREKMIVFVFQILMIVGLFLNTETLVFFASYSSIFGLLFWSAVVSKRDN